MSSEDEIRATCAEVGGKAIANGANEEGSSRRSEVQVKDSSRILRYLPRAEVKDMDCVLTVTNCKPAAVCTNCYGASEI